MSFQSILTYCIANKLELISVVFSLLSVWYASRENILVYPTGIVAVVIASYIYFTAKLYGDFGVQLYYFAASIYGWVYWTKLNRQKKSISQIEHKQEYFIYIGITLLSFIGFYTVLIHTDTDIPFADSVINAVFITGMVLMARKKIENWIIWIVGDIGSVFISLYKQLHFFAAQYILFTILAAFAWYAWHKKLKHDQTN